MTRATAAAWAVRALGALFILIGAVLLIGGARLLMLGGSAYYLLAGVGLVAGAGVEPCIE